MQTSGRPYYKQTGKEASNPKLADHAQLGLYLGQECFAAEGALPRTLPQIDFCHLWSR